MLDIMKVLIISNEISEYQNIRTILNPLKAFELNYANDIEHNACYYDLIIADLDSFNDCREIEVFEKLKQANDKASIIFMKSIKDSNSVKGLEGITVLDKPATELRLIECIYKTIIKDIYEAL